MAKINVTQGTAGAYGAGELQLQNKAQMDATLRIVTDNLNTASPLKLSTALVQSTSTVKITTSDVAYIDAEDNSGNNRFTVSRAVASQLVTVDFASLPTALTTPVGAIRTATDGVNLANVMTFLENGKIGIGTDTPNASFKMTVNSGANINSFVNGDKISYSRTSDNVADVVYLSRTNDLGSNGTANIQGYDGIQFRTQGPESVKAIITDTGNVGIGTASPTALLHLEKASQDNILAVVGQNGYEGALFLSAAGSGKDANIVTGNSRSLVFYSTANSTPAASGTRILTIDSQGIKFGTDTAAANALDDYEEGTWTMGIAFNNSSTGVAYTANTGTYTKIGRQVTVTGFLILSNKGTSVGGATITGLPFTVTNNNPFYSSVSLRTANISFINQFQGYGAINTTTIELEQVTSLGVTTSLLNTDFANNSNMIVSLTYFV